MAPTAVIERQLARKPAVSLLGGLEGHGIGPLGQEGLDEPLRLAVGPRYVGPGADGLEIHGGAGLPPFAGAEGRTVVREDTTAGDSLLAEPAHGTSQEADRGGFLLVGQDFHVGQACGVVDGDMHLLVAGASRTALTTIAGDAVPDPLETGKLLGVDMDHVARLLPLVPLNRGFGLEVPQPPEPQSLHRPPDGRQRSPHSLCDPPEGAALVPEIHGMVQLLRIERPPLDAANTPSIRQRGVTTGAVSSQPLVGGAQADPRLGGQEQEGFAVVNVSAQQPFPAEGCQPGIRVGMHGA